MAPTERDTYAAYVDDANEDTGSSIEGTRKYALSDEMPPPRHPPNVGRIVTDHPQGPSRRSASSSNRASFAESDSARSSNKGSDKPRDPEARREKTRPADSRRTSQQYESDREKEHQRRRHERKSREADGRRSQEHSPKESSNSKKTRPSVEHGPPPPHPMSRGVSDEYPRYVYQQQHRPRAASRSATYDASQPLPPHGPPGGMPWHHPHFPPGHFHPGPPGPPMPYPPPMHDMSPRGMPPPSPIGMPPPNYFPAPPHPAYNDHLKARFDSRPPSAMGALGGPERLPPGYAPDEYGDESAPTVSRRPSRASRGEHDRQHDRQKMPPPDRIPQRTMSAAPQHSAYRPPPGRPQVRQNPPRSSANRHSLSFGDDYDYEEYDPSHDLFQDASPEPSYRQRRYEEAARPRRGSQIYEEVDIIPAGRRNRRPSVYAPGGLGRVSGGKYAAQYADAKIRDAQDYQDAVTGGPKTPLTAEMLHKATRGNPGSQSTRSSGSRDDSEYRRSCTTGITRSSSGNGAEDVTIKVGNAVFTVQGGAEITLSSRGQPQIRSGSDRSSTVYQIEDGREHDREPPRMTLPHRIRAPSHSESRSRGYIGNATYSPYEQVYADGNYL